MNLKAIVFLVSTLLCGRAAVVINEVMYHPPRDEDLLQYVELLNTGGEAVDLSGWTLKGGLKFSFPKGSSIGPKGLLVVARDLDAWKRIYGTAIPVLGNFTGRLKHRGEKIELKDATGKEIESFKFADGAPWPAGPDGYGSSLERICPAAAATDPANWAASKPVRGRTPAGTPGRANDSYTERPLPAVTSVMWEKIVKPGEAIPVTVEAAEELDHATVHYTLFRHGSAPQTGEVRLAGTGKKFTGNIPALTDGMLARFTIEAAGSGGAVRIVPCPTEPRRAFSAFANSSIARGTIPVVSILNVEPVRGGGNKFRPPSGNTEKPGNSAVFYLPVQGEAQLFDFVQVRRRAGGWKAHFFKDEKLDEMTALNMIFEGPPRWVLSEHLSYELYRKAGMRIEKSGHYRLQVDGRPLGYFLFVEQPNKNFLARSGRNEDSNIYKIAWFGNGITGQHEKKNNPGSGHGDIVTLINTLNQKSGKAQWDYINEQFSVEAFVNYYAVNMCIQNWDGFFNNYFTVHDTRPGGKWDIIPWDEDKTWGEYDGGPGDYDWFDMPLTTGMKGDSSGRGWFGGGPFGGKEWWRPPGWFSGPLLANPAFRQKFLARLRELCMESFTEERFGPVIEALHQQLRPEVEYRARLGHADARAALREFDAHIASFHRQLASRRSYILKHLD